MKNFVLLGLLKNCNHRPFMHKRPYFLAVVLTILCATSLVKDLVAQDPEFSQFYANQLYLNPAFTGTKHCPRLALNYRNQYPAIPGSFVTTAASYDQYVAPVNGGLGLQVYSDNAGIGTLKTFSISGMYAYQTALTDNISASAGVQATYFQKSLDWSKLTFGDMIDPRKGFIYETQDIPRGGSVSNVDFSAGMLLYNETFYAGFAVHHLTTPNESLIVGTSNLERKFTFHAGAVIPVAKDVTGSSETSISPNVLYQLQGSAEQINLGLDVKKGPVVGGVWYRFNTKNPENAVKGDALIFLLGIQTDIIHVGYSYDLTVSQLGTSTGGAHELSFAYQFNCKQKKKKFKAVPCPTM